MVMIIRLFIILSIVSTYCSAEGIEQMPFAGNRVDANDTKPQVSISPDEATGQINSKSGILKIIVYPKDANVYINGKHAGKGDLTKTLPIGKYDIYVTYKKRTKSKNVFVIVGRTREVTIRIGLSNLADIKPSFTQIWVDGALAFGPSLHIELRRNRHLFGISYQWALLNPIDEYELSLERPDSDGWTLGGSLFTWHYQVFSLKDIVCLYPGFSVGFWYFNGYHYSQTPEYDSYHESDHFPVSKAIRSYMFGGPSLEISLGYKILSVNVGYSLLIGSTPGHKLTTGFRVKL